MCPRRQSLPSGIARMQKRLGGQHGPSLLMTCTCNRSPNVSELLGVPRVQLRAVLTPLPFMASQRTPHTLVRLCSPSTATCLLWPLNQSPVTGQRVSLHPLSFLMCWEDTEFGLMGGKWEEQISVFQQGACVAGQD